MAPPSHSVNAGRRRAGTVYRAARVDVSILAGAQNY